MAHRGQGASRCPVSQGSGGGTGHSRVSPGAGVGGLVLAHVSLAGRCWVCVAPVTRHPGGFRRSCKVFEKLPAETGSLSPHREWGEGDSSTSRLWRRERPCGHQAGAGKAAVSVTGLCSEGLTRCMVTAGTIRYRASISPHRTRLDSQAMRVLRVWLPDVCLSSPHTVHFNFFFTFIYS